jgi:flagellar protein FliS
MRNPTLARALSAYATANTAAIPPLVAVLRLYEKAMAHLHQARDAAREGRFDAHFNAIDRAITILLGLDSILNLDKGGDVARTLRRFYRSLVGQAGLAAARRDPVAATEAVIRQLSSMLRAWQSIAAERGMEPSTIGPPVKGPQAPMIGRSMDHAHGGGFG